MKKLFSTPATQLGATGLAGTAEYADATLLTQHHTRYLTAQLYQWPAQLAPVAIAPVPGPQLIVQLTGAMQLDLACQGKHRRLLAQPGSVYLSAVGQPGYEMAWQGLSQQPITTVHVQLDNELLSAAAVEAGFDPARLEIRDDSCIDDPLLRELGRALVPALPPSPGSSSLYLDTVAHMLAGQLVHHHSTRPAQPSRLTGGTWRTVRLQQVRDYVQAHLSRRIALEELASVACLSTYHFCRSFKRATGLTAHQYVQRQRIERAEHLLQQGAGSVAQVARQVGYQSAGHFATVFQQLTGKFPSAVSPSLRNR